MDRIKDDFHLKPPKCRTWDLPIPTTETGQLTPVNLNSPAELIVIWGFNLWTGSLHQLQVHDPIENPETMNRPSLEFPKQRPSQDTNTIFSVHVVSLREVSTRSMSQTGFGAIFFFSTGFFLVRSDSYFSINPGEVSEQKLAQLAVYY